MRCFWILAQFIVSYSYIISPTALLELSSKEERFDEFVFVSGSIHNVELEGIYKRVRSRTMKNGGRYRWYQEDVERNVYVQQLPKQQQPNCLFWTYFPEPMWRIMAGCPSSNSISPLSDMNSNLMLAAMPSKAVTPAESRGWWVRPSNYSQSGATTYPGLEWVWRPADESKSKLDQYGLVWDGLMIVQHGDKYTLPPKVNKDYRILCSDDPGHSLPPAVVQFDYEVPLDFVLSGPLHLFSHALYTWLTNGRNGSPVFVLKSAANVFRHQTPAQDHALMMWQEIATPKTRYLPSWVISERAYDRSKELAEWLPSEILDEGSVPRAALDWPNIPGNELFADLWYLKESKRQINLSIRGLLPHNEAPPLIIKGSEKPSIDGKWYPVHHYMSYPFFRHETSRLVLYRGFSVDTIGGSRWIISRGLGSYECIHGFTPDKLRGRWPNELQDVLWSIWNGTDWEKKSLSIRLSS